MKLAKDLFLVLSSLVIDLVLIAFSLFTSVTVLIHLVAPAINQYFNSIAKTPVSAELIIMLGGLIGFVLVGIYLLQKLLYQGLSVLVMLIWPYDLVAGEVLNRWINKREHDV